MVLEKLFEILRNEKKSDELSALPECFLGDYEETVTKLQENEKADIEELRELQNTIKLFGEIISRRTRKILNIAQQKSFVRGVVFDESILLDQEKELFDGVLECVRRHKDNFNFSNQKKINSGEVDE